MTDTEGRQRDLGEAMILVLLLLKSELSYLLLERVFISPSPGHEHSVHTKFISHVGVNVVQMHSKT